MCKTEERKILQHFSTISFISSVDRLVVYRNIWSVWASCRRPWHISPKIILAVRNFLHWLVSQRVWSTESLPSDEGMFMKQILSSYRAHYSHFFRKNSSFDQYFISTADQHVWEWPWQFGAGIQDAAHTSQHATVIYDGSQPDRKRGRWDIDDFSVWNCVA